MKVELIHGNIVFERLAGEWDELAGRSMTDTPFQSLAYQRGWWHHLHPDDGTLHSIAVRDDNGCLRAIGCFYLIEGTLFFNGCIEETDYLDLIVPADLAAEAWTAVFGCLAGPDFPAWRALDLCNVPYESPTRTILPRVAENCGLIFSTEIHEVCPIIDLPDSFDAYLSQLDKKQRHEIRRKLRRADAAGMELTVVNGGSDLGAAVDEFLVLLQKSTVEKRAWLNDHRRALFHEIAQAAAAAGTLQLLFVGVNGRKAAALFNFDYGDCIWVYNSGLDPDAFGHLSPGVVVTTRAIEIAIANGRRQFDFLRGDEIYKYRFGAQDTTVHRMHVERQDV